MTDWWAQGTVPTTYCQMHKTQSVCAETGDLASPYCPNVISRGVIVIPSGHPLYKFIGTEYESVLSQYLGSSATIKYDGSGSVISGGQVCTVHGAGASSGGNYVVENTLIPDAQLLIQQAQAQLNNMDASSANYAVLQSAISNLQSVISSSNPSTTEVAAAMGQLTTAMAGGY